ncbi:PVC-type heme-binding CxxCH protein [Planctomicrobium piriforme]|uniref:Putative membrane-bound dehydrogenase domain-containing protein n=1 Tax=Planctomicrobium piriforme TaxID=1576369 RepID=A0A1I3E476_9PLAN|nr:PVC-type heme-binding CxxCH protein [Planctomicrobium piriforme]SFH93669.1 putative membrane-bound dehydrogenase domain-containing protein [Planctomicrobium piriforme]
MLFRRIARCGAPFCAGANPFLFTAGLLLGLVCLTATPTLAEPPKFELKDGDRVVFLGSEFTEQEIKHNFLEAALSMQWPDRKISFRNLGWAGDDPTAVARGYFGGAEEGYRRLLEEFDRLKPTVIFVYYGENGAYSGAAGLPKFMESFAKLINDLKKHTDRIVIVSPPAAELLHAPLPDPAQVNENRVAMSEKLKEFAAAGNYQFLDLYDPTKTAFDKEVDPLTYDTIRFNAPGYQAAADGLLKQLAIPTVEERKPDPTLMDLIATKNELFFHRYRPQNETYLRGFRKHEQGQNAKEISEFDPLIERAEEQIAAYLQGKPMPPSIKMPDLPPLDFKPLTPEAQTATFTLDDGLEIAPFASEPMVANPIHMNFDSLGRLWVASSPIYPQLRPGAKPNDSIIILEDTDKDGKADKKTVFAEGLLIPTAVLPDERGGAYVANSTELLHLSDIDGDGVADERHVLLSGFGTEDTHHILHTFRWSPDVLLSFNQSIYIHSHLETPYGVQKMLGSGIWRYREGTARANTVMFGLINPWGHIYDDWGQEFATDGAGGDGINYVFPGAAYATAVGYDRVLKGMNPGQPKHCGLEIITGRHFPEEWQGTLVAADFRGNRINRFQLSEQGSGYASKQLEDLLSCQDRAFRPVDLKLGPDGALYIADWHDAIINHGEVDFRDPRRDDRHGRIWRITAKGRPAVPKVNLDEAGIDELLGMLDEQEQWTRQMARVQLTLRDHDQVETALTKWVSGLDPKSPNFERSRLEALWAYQAIGQVPGDFLKKLLASTDHRVRANAIRVLSQSTSETYGLPAHFPVTELLKTAIGDKNAQVRLEAVNALRAVGTGEAADLALRALDQEMDTYLDFALYITMRELQSQWLPRLENGQAEFKGNLAKTLFALKAIDNAAAVGPLMTLLTTDQIPADKLSDVLGTIGKFAEKADARVLLDRALAKPAERGALLSALATAADKRQIIPEGDLSGLDQLLGDEQGLKLAGLWQQKQTQPKLLEIVVDEKQPPHLRRGALAGLAGLKEKDQLQKFAADEKLPPAVRRYAVVSLMPLDGPQAAQLAVSLLSQATEKDDGEVNALLDVFLGAKSGPEQLAAALKDKKLIAHVATLSVRRSESAGKRGEPLVTAMRTAGGLSGVPKSLTPDELAALLAQVQKQGDPNRGEAIYRRKELTCITCHSLGGAGGLVGPDMLSLGASSPPDYIVQSLLDPSAKIKEGYHTVTVATTDGKVVNGVMVREGADELVLRDAQNREVAIPKGDIDERVNSPTSMMPADLIAKLPRDEFVDLVAFLSSLGKEGPFKIPQNRFVRKWTSTDGQVWYSKVDGGIPINDIPGKTLSFDILVTAPGAVALKVNDLEGLRITRGEQKDNLRAEKIVSDLPAGKHTFHFQQTGTRTVPLSVEIVDVDGSAGRAEVVNR